MGEQDGRQASIPDFCCDLYRDGCRFGDAQPGSLPCGGVLQLHMVEGLLREEAWLSGRDAVRAGEAASGRAGNSDSARRSPGKEDITMR